MTDEEGGSSGWQEKRKEDRQQRTAIVQLLKRGQLVKGQTLTFNYKRSSFDCVLKGDGKLLYHDEGEGKISEWEEGWGGQRCDWKLF